MSGVRPFARAIKNPDNPEFVAEDLLQKVAGASAMTPVTAPVLLPKEKEEETVVPVAPVKVVKFSRLSVYLTPDEHWFVRDRANARRMSLNDYVRSVLLAKMEDGLRCADETRA
jgi:hypothetical protein